MTITYITNSNLFSKSAHVVNILLMCEAMAANGHKVLLIVPDNNGSLEFDILRKQYNLTHTFEIIFIRTIDKRFFRNISFFFNSLRVVRRFNPTLYYVRLMYDYLYVYFLTGNIFIETHSPLRKNIILKKIQSLSYKKKSVKKIIVITNELKKIITQELPILKNKILVASDAARLPNPKENSKKLNGNYEINIGYIGHLYSGRGIELILELARRNSEMGFHVIGGKSENVSFYKEKARSANVIFYGHINHADVAGYAKNLDMLLAPYQKTVQVPGGIDTSGWMSPLKIFEYMSFGKPFICSDLPVLREILRDGENCILVQPGNIEEWNNALTILAGNSFLQNALKENAYKEFVQNYTWNSRAEKIIKSLENQS